MDLVLLESMVGQMPRHVLGSHHIAAEGVVGSLFPPQFVDRLNANTRPPVAPCDHSQTGIATGPNGPSTGRLRQHGVLVLAWTKQFVVVKESQRGDSRCFQGVQDRTPCNPMILKTIKRIKMTSKLTPAEIQDINRRIAAGTYEHKEEPSPKPRKRTTARREKPKPTEADSDE